LLVERPAPTRASTILTATATPSITGTHYRHPGFFRQPRGQVGHAGAAQNYGFATILANRAGDLVQ
jgi:hypothetical protein